MLKLYPMPTDFTEFDGEYSFDYVSVSGIENETVLGEYSDRGIVLSDNIPNVVYTKKEGIDEQGYKLNINENGVELFYSCEQGAFYGTQTLCQLINMKSVPFVEIKDAPLNKNRVFHLDISRGKLPTMKHFKEIIDYAAMGRYSIFSLYYDRIIIQFPKLEGLWEEDSYTMEEMWQIKKWINDKFMKMNIQIRSFGHLGNYLCHDRFKHLSNSLDENNPGGDLNPLDPRSVEFVDMLLEDVMPFNDCEYQVIGTDEIQSLRTGKSKSEVERRGLNAVFMEFVGKTTALVRDKYHKIPLISGDMFFNKTFTDKEIRENLKAYPKGTITSCWGYESEYERYDFDRFNRLLNEAGIKYENCSGTGLWAQYVPRTYNQTLQAEVVCRMGYENGAYSVAQSLWGDRGNSQFFVMELGGIFTFGAAAWNCYDFQLSYVHEYMDKYVYKSTKGSMARLIASLGDAAWFAKGRVPESNTFAWSFKRCYKTEPIWNGYHPHTGIKKIYFNDFIDEYGCQRAIDHIENSKKLFGQVDFCYKDSSIEKEKIYLNLRMFELSVRVDYFNLCALFLKDYDTARSLIASIEECYKDIFANYKRLWLTENRENGSQKFICLLKDRKSDFDKCVKEVLQ